MMEAFIQGADYDMDADYEGILKADFSDPGFGVCLYDNIYRGYSPEGKNTIGILALQGYARWEEFAEDYWKGNKEDYMDEKEKMADILIRKVEEKVLPRLSRRNAVKEVRTVLTNIRYTRNYRGAIYGWAQTVDNSAP